MTITAYDLAARFIGVKEIAGAQSNPVISAMLALDAGLIDDQTPWCSGFANWIAWMLRLPRSKSLAARSWLSVGTPLDASSSSTRQGFDVVILSRGLLPQPDHTVLSAPGHVGFFSAFTATEVYLLGGNQGNAVTIAPFPRGRILGVRRLREE